MSELVSAHGGAVIGELFFKLDADRESFDSAIKEIIRVGPDVIFCNLVGPSVADFYQAYEAAGLDPSRMPIVSLTTSETHIQEMGTSAAVGHITAAPYFQSVQTQKNRDVLKRFAKWIDRPFVTNMGWETAFTQFSMVSEIIAQLGSANVELVRNKLFDLEFAAPQGLIKLDAQTNHSYLWPRIGRVNEAGQFDILEESRMPIKPDPYLTSHRNTAWSMAHAT